MAICSKLERTYSLHVSEGVVTFALLFDPPKLPGNSSNKLREISNRVVAKFPRELSHRFAQVWSVSFNEVV